MKRSLVAIATLSAAGLACAQSSVTLFGTADVNLQFARQGGASVTRLNGSGANSYSALGFRGVEDLGGGLNASFWLEAALNMDSGTGAFGTTLNNQVVAPGSSSTGLVFNRRSTVSLSSDSLGELRIGRDVTPTYWNLTLFDPFGTTGSGAASQISTGPLTPVSALQTSIRASNAVMYFTPGCTAAYGGPFGCSGFYGQFMQAFGENASNAANSQDGNYTGVRAGWAAGAFNVSAALGTTRLASGNVSARNLGASWNLGSTQLMAQVFNDKAAAPTVPGSSNGWLIGARTSFSNVQIPISFTTIRNNTAGSPSAGKFSVGYIYNLSKRTALYTTYSTLSNKNGAAAGGGGVPAVANASWTGIDFGLRHHF